MVIHNLFILKITALDRGSTPQLHYTNLCENGGMRGAQNMEGPQEPLTEGTGGVFSQ